MEKRSYINLHIYYEVINVQTYNFIDLSITIKEETKMAYIIEVMIT